jgi:hypothetical protein
MEVTLSLSFACCCCHDAITVTLKCQGAALANRMEEVVAAVHVPCPQCGQMNELLFDPRGVVHDVRPAFAEQPSPAPSVN